MSRVEQGSGLQEQEIFQRQINYLVFDMDGVLIDTTGAIMEITPRHAQYYLDMMGTPTSKLYDTLWDQPEFWKGYADSHLPKPKEWDGVNFIDRMATLFDYMLANAEGDPFPDVVSTLELLKNQGFKISVASSHKKAVIEKRLKKAGLSDYFDHIVGKDQPEITKGEPQFRILANAYRVPYEQFIDQLVFVDDGPKKKYFRLLDKLATNYIIKNRRFEANSWKSIKQV